jgi:hypothetical protein
LSSSSSTLITDCTKEAIITSGLGEEFGFKSAVLRPLTMFAPKSPLTPPFPTDSAKAPTDEPPREVAFPPGSRPGGEAGERTDDASDEDQMALKTFKRMPPSSLFRTSSVADDEESSRCIVEEAVSEK